MPETLTYVYTSQAELERVFSITAVNRRADLDKDGIADPLVIDETANIATDEINLYCEPHYNASDMVNNLWIRRQATYIGCFHLSLLRGHPAQFKTYYEKIVQWLEKIREGSLQVPRLYKKSNMSPSVSNYVVDNRYRYTQERVIPSVSPGGITGDQHLLNYLDLDSYW